MNVEIINLTRRFGRTEAVAGVSLTTGPGVLGLLGPNGAGKTSLLRMMATVIQPSSGSLRLLGNDPRRYGPRREVRRARGYLPQNLGYYPGFTVTEFVEYLALLKAIPPGQVSFRTFIRDLGQAATVVVSTHLVEDVGAACTEVTLMDAGKFSFQAPRPS